MMQDVRLARRLSVCLAKLRGKTCWGVAAGKGTGSAIVLDFGTKIPRRDPISNPALSAMHRRLEGEVALYIRCAWRLDSKAGVLCGSTDSNSLGGPMVTGLLSLCDRRVRTVDVSRPGFDVKLGFVGGLRLWVFCDQTNSDDGADNLSLLLKDVVLTVGPKSQISVENRKASTP